MPSEGVYIYLFYKNIKGINYLSFHPSNEDIFAFFVILISRKAFNNNSLPFSLESNYSSKQTFGLSNTVLI